MANTLNTGATALIAFQRAIAATANNISNVNTEGYSRQRIDMEAVPSTRNTVGSIGQGVHASTVSRITDQFAQERLLNTTNEVARTEALATSASRLDSLVGTDSLDLTPALSSFFAAMHDANTSPDNIPARAVVLATAGQLESRLNGLAENFRQEDKRTTDLIQQSVDTINETTAQLAQLNYQLNTSGDTQPLHLLDQRDVLLQRLSQELTIDYNENDSGSIDVFIGNGASLLMGDRSYDMQVDIDPMAPHQLPVTLQIGSETHWIGSQISGGKLSGLNDYRQQILAPAQNDIGRLANVLSGTLNDLQNSGIDLQGNSGVNLFSSPEVHVTADDSNTGSATVQATFTDMSQTEASSYQLSYDGVDYTVTRTSDGATFTGISPMTVDGMTIEITNPMDIGDRFMIEPTRYAARDFSVALADPSALALSSSLRIVDDAANSSIAGTASVTPVDAANAEFSTPVQISFNDPPDSYDVIDLNTGATLQSGVAWTSGDTIDQNGWSVAFSGNPGANDAYRIEPAGAPGDNSNGLTMAAMQDAKLFSGVQSLSEKYAETMATIGTRTLQATGNHDAAVGLNNSALEQRDSVSGVNLDEEAVSLTRYQQAYQASAQIITVAEETFQTLINAIGR
jgi:flagellar hook-associated protein 1 FlgK